MKMVNYWQSKNTFKNEIPTPVWGAESKQNLISLERVSIRRLCFYIEKQVSRFFRNRKCSFNHKQISWQELCEEVGKYSDEMMQDVLNRKVVFDYEVKEFNNKKDVGKVEIKFHHKENGNPIQIDFDLTFKKQEDQW